MSSNEATLATLVVAERARAKTLTEGLDDGEAEYL